MMQMLTGFAVTQIIGVAAAYKIADHLAKGALSAKQIAAAEGISADATFRLLRACASLGLVTCDATLTFSAPPLLSTLRLDVRGSLSNLAMAWAAPSTWLPSGRFADAVRTGERQTVPAIGAEFWDYLAQHPAEGAIFTSAIREAAGTVIDWFLAVSQSGVNDNARFICRINARRSAAIFGRPPSERDFQ